MPTFSRRSESSGLLFTSTVIEKLHFESCTKNNRNMYLKTRMHSSRMRTVRFCPYLPACTVQRGSATRGVSATRGCQLPRGGVCYQGGCLLPGGPEGCIPACTEADPPVNRMTDRCKNITLPQTSFAGCKNNTA